MKIQVAGSRNGHTLDAFERQQLGGATAPQFCEAAGEVAWRARNKPPPKARPSQRWEVSPMRGHLFSGRRLPRRRPQTSRESFVESLGTIVLRAWRASARPCVVGLSRVLIISDGTRRDGR